VTLLVSTGQALCGVNCFTFAERAGSPAWLPLFVICVITADVEPEVARQGQKSLQRQPVEFGCVLSGV
jgi:hypothetical protein